MCDGTKRFIKTAKTSTHCLKTLTPYLHAMTTSPNNNTDFFPLTHQAGSGTVQPPILTTMETVHMSSVDFGIITFKNSWSNKKSSFPYCSVNLQIIYIFFIFKIKLFQLQWCSSIVVSTSQTSHSRSERTSTSTEIPGMTGWYSVCVGIPCRVQCRIRGV